MRSGRSSGGRAAGGTSMTTARGDRRGPPEQVAGDHRVKEPAAPHHQADVDHMASLLPVGSTAPERRKRTSRACTSMGSCSTSSRNSVPPWASSSLPSRRTGPPFPGTSAPKRSASICKGARRHSSRSRMDHAAAVPTDAGNGRADPSPRPARRRAARGPEDRRRPAAAPRPASWPATHPPRDWGRASRSCCPGWPGRMGSYHPTWCTSP